MCFPKIGDDGPPLSLQNRTLSISGEGGEGELDAVLLIVKKTFPFVISALNIHKQIAMYEDVYIILYANEISVYAQCVSNIQVTEICSERLQFPYALQSC